MLFKISSGLVFLLSYVNVAIFVSGSIYSSYIFYITIFQLLFTSRSSHIFFTVSS
jgi:hypothetical protein